jgi:hypothetical protein
MDGLGPSVMFEVEPAAPLPTALGSLLVQPKGVGPLRVATSSGSCDTEIEADRVGIELVPAADLVPWLSVLYFETEVDGLRWIGWPSAGGVVPPGESWEGRARDLLYTVCASEDLGASPGLDPGTHTVTLRARLLGSTTELAASTTLELDCGDVDPPCTGCEENGSDGGGCDAGGGAGTGLLGLGLALAALGVSGRSRRPRSSR